MSEGIDLAPDKDASPQEVQGANKWLTGTEVDDRRAADVNVVQSVAIQDLASERSITTELDAIEVTFNNTTTQALSSDISATGYRWFTLMGQMAFSGTPTGFTLLVQQKDAFSDYRTREDSYIAQWSYTRAMITANDDICCHFKIPGGTFRFRVLTQGTTAGNTITLSNMSGLLST